MNDLAQYMKNRRSALSLTLDAPGPDEETICSILEISTRVPDHGKLAPWRVEHWTTKARQAMNGHLLALLEDDSEDPDIEKKRQSTNKLLHAPCLLAVISQAQGHPKIPEWEQILSAGAVCMNTLIAANAHGFEAQWLTAWYIYDIRASPILRLNPGEQIAGLIHIGSSTTPKSDRPRPDIDQLYSIRNT